MTHNTFHTEKDKLFANEVIPMSNRRATRKKSSVNSSLLEYGFPDMTFQSPDSCQSDK